MARSPSVNKQLCDTFPLSRLYLSHIPRRGQKKKKQKNVDEFTIPLALWERVPRIDRFIAGMHRFAYEIQLNSR